MPFVWTTSAGSYTEWEQTAEIKDAVDHILIDHLAIPTGYTGWSEIPTSAGELVEVIDMYEIRDAMDFLYDNNQCNAQKVGQYIGQDVTHKGTYNSSEKGTENSLDLNTVNSGFRTAECAGQYSGQLSGYDGVYHNSRQVTQNYSECFSHNLSRLLSVGQYPP